MGRIAIITDDPGWHGSQLRQAFASRGYSSEYTSLTQCRLNIMAQDLPVMMPGFETQLPDAVFVRGVPGGSLEEVIFYLDVLHALKIVGVPVYNDGRMIERSVDKAMTSLLLKKHNIPTPSTWIIRDRDQALDIAENELRAKHRFVTKPLFGSQGEGLRRFEKMTDLFWLASHHGIYYLQRFIEQQPEGFSDWRVFVINGQAIAAMQRQGKTWLNNVSRGARCVASPISDPLRQLAEKSTQALAMDYAGVDIIRDQKGHYWVIEINSIPAWKGLQSVTTINLAQQLVDDFTDRYLHPNSQKSSSACL
ncbi:MAG: RimK family alpha-L-glutamate ligase [Methylococcaceae bacterium]